MHDTAAAVDLQPRPAVKHAPAPAPAADLGDLAGPADVAQRPGLQPAPVVQGEIPVAVRTARALGPGPAQRDGLPRPAAPRDSHRRAGRTRRHRCPEANSGTARRSPAFSCPAPGSNLRLAVEDHDADQPVTRQSSRSAVPPEELHPKDFRSGAGRGEGGQAGAAAVGTGAAEGPPARRCGPRFEPHTVRVLSIRTLALLTRSWGAKRGANDQTTGLRRATSSHYHCGGTARQATSSTSQARFESAS